MLKFIKELFVPSPEAPAPDSLVLFTPNDGSWNVKQVRQLFDAGVGRLHVQYRRDWQLKDYEDFLKNIPETFWPRIVLEDQPELVLSCKLGGLQIHPTERVPRRWPKHGVLSAKCHSYDELLAVDKSCRYVFLTPIFESVSKKDHRPRRTVREYAVILERWKSEGGCPAYALGGITPENIGEVREMGFDGAAFIGSVWKEKDPVRAFLDLERAWSGRDARKLKRKY
jgi:thiamine-phosphate pyrophosphorylase